MSASEHFSAQGTVADVEAMLEFAKLGQIAIHSIALYWSWLYCGRVGRASWGLNALHGSAQNCTHKCIALICQTEIQIGAMQGTV